MSSGPRKGEQARQRVLDAVVEAVARRGLADLSIAEIGGTVGMSAGHVLYYFGTKDVLFVEALRHIETRLGAERAAIVRARTTPLRRLHRYIALYLPTGPHDSRWVLWVEVWNRSLTDPDLGLIQLELDARWQRDLGDIIASGVESGEFTVPRPAPVAGAIAALLDGLAIRVLTGAPAAPTPAALRRLAQTQCSAMLGVRDQRA